MSNTVALLDKARALCKPATDYRLAKVLDINQESISNARLHGGGLDPAAVHKLARFLEQDYETVMALVQLDRERRPKVRDYWEKVAPRVVPSLVVGLLAAAIWRLSPELRDATHFALLWSVVPFDTLYIMRSLGLVVLAGIVVARAMTAPAKNPVTAMAGPGARWV